MNVYFLTANCLDVGVLSGSCLESFVDLLRVLEALRDCVELVMADASLLLLCQRFSMAHGAVAHAVRDAGLLGVVDAQDVIRILSRVQQAAKSVESELGDCAGSCSSAPMHPNVLADEVLKVAWWQRSRPVRAVVVASCGVGVSLSIDAEVHVADCLQDAEVPLRLRATLPLVSKRVQIADVFDLEHTWQNRCQRSDVGTVIEVLAWRAIPHLAAAQRKITLKVGKNFVSTVVHYGFDHDPPKVRKLIRRIFDVICGEKERKGHALREGASGAESPIVRGGWEAWRYDLDNEFHLHVWRQGIGGTLVIELADVVVHGGLSITQ